jgi:hypothetical protein
VLRSRAEKGEGGGAAGGREDEAGALGQAEDTSGLENAAGRVVLWRFIGVFDKAVLNEDAQIAVAKAAVPQLADLDREIPFGSSEALRAIAGLEQRRCGSRQLGGPRRSVP